MFQVRPLEGYRWIIVDNEDRQVFEGTWTQCESWLDAYENLNAIPPPRGFFNRCWQALFRGKQGAAPDGVDRARHPISANPAERNN
ncbi:MAG: hypothetical protein WD065_10395 [Planctomycetaceae bacterium]